MAKALIIDIGNTRQKLALFKNGKISGRVQYLKPSDTKGLNREIKRCSPDMVLISSVLRKIPKIKENVTVLSFNSQTPVPLKNRYRTRFTLGSDRLAAAVGAGIRFPGKNVLVVDLGTCIKFNFVNAKGEYLGGSIAPGLEMRFKALHNFTARLPLIEMKGDTKLIGTGTDESLRSGVVNGITEELKGMIQAYKKKYPGLVVVATGGDSPRFVKRLKMRIFEVPNLVLEGLHSILLFNAEKYLA